MWWTLSSPWRPNASVPVGARTAATRSSNIIDALATYLLASRRKSETRRPGAGSASADHLDYAHGSHEAAGASTTSSTSRPLALPPASDFRTSLILPRFVPLSRLALRCPSLGGADQSCYYSSLSLRNTT